MLAEAFLDITGASINPSERTYPEEMIQTGEFVGWFVLSVFFEGVNSRPRRACGVDGLRKPN